MPDEVGRSIELTGADDAELLRSDLAHGLALPLTIATAVPSVEAASGVTVQELTAALEAVVGTDTVPDLNQNGITGEDANDNGVPDDHEVLPGAFAAFLAGQMSIEDFQQLLAGAPDVWANGGTFLSWEPPPKVASPHWPALALLLESLPQVCLHRGAHMHFLAFNTEANLVQRDALACTLLRW